MRKKKDRRIHTSTLRVLLIALLTGLLTLTFSFTLAWGNRMESIEKTASADVFAHYETETLFGEPFTAEDTSEAAVTAYNIWETTCPACLGEMGELEELSHAYPPEEFRLVGVCADLYDSKGELKQSQLEKAQYLMNDAGTTFEHIIPTKEMMDFITSVVAGYPTTFFVDRDGKIISYTTGAKDLEGWTRKVDEVLKEVK